MRLTFSPPASSALILFKAFDFGPALHRWFRYQQQKMLKQLTCRVLKSLFCQVFKNV